MTFISLLSVVVLLCGVPPGVANSVSDVAMVLSSFVLLYLAGFVLLLGVLCVLLRHAVLVRMLVKCSVVEKRSKDPDVRYDLVSGT